jgi:TolB-like protein/DNA-binding winged helix-turn-helix (wHTH) protein
MPNLVRFDCYEVDLPAGQLYKHGLRISLRDKSFQVLAALLEHPGEMVTREDLRRRLWREEVFVDFDNNLNTAIARLREALGDSADHPRFIETLPKHGYRFIASLSDTPAAETRPLQPAPERPRATREATPRWRQRGYVLLLGAGLVVALVFVLDLGGIRNRLWRQQISVRAAPIRIESLAVLPFQNLSGDRTQDYLSDGFTDQLITNLAEQTRIRIVSRSSVMRYQGTRKPLPEIARELNVDAIVEGSVSLSERQVRITAQLIQASSDRHLWAHSYERDRKDLFSIQSEVAAAITSLIRAKAGGLGSPGAHSAAAPQRFTAETYELALECQNLRKTGRNEDINHAIQCYQHILTVDPHSAAAYAEIASCYMMRADPRAQAAAIKALDLDSSLPEAHLALAEFRLQQIDLTGAEREFEQALALNPSYAQAHVRHADALVAAGRMTEATAEAKAARELDPFSAGIAVFSGRVLFWTGHFDKAIEEEKAALDLDPNRDRAHYWTGYGYEQQGMYKDAIAEFDKGLPNDDHGIFLAALGRSFALAGDSKRAAEVKRKIEHYSGKDFIWPYDAALFYAALGDNDRAFYWLEKEREIHGGWLAFLRVDPRLANLRSDPRLAALAHRIGLPE